jgi:hypothetical protein
LFIGAKAFAVALDSGSDLYLTTAGFGVTNKFKRVAAALLPIWAKRSFPCDHETSVFTLNKTTTESREMIFTEPEVWANCLQFKNSQIKGQAQIINFCAITVSTLIM